MAKVFYKNLKEIKTGIFSTKIEIELIPCNVIGKSKMITGSLHNAHFTDSVVIEIGGEIKEVLPYLLVYKNKNDIFLIE